MRMVIYGPDDCDLQLGRFVTIKRTISIDYNSFGCKYPSAAATRSATPTKNEDGDRPTSGRKASTITFALPRSSISRTRLSKATTISSCAIVGHELLCVHVLSNSVSLDILDATIGQSHECTCRNQSLYHLFVTSVAA